MSRLKLSRYVWKPRTKKLRIVRYAHTLDGFHSLPDRALLELRQRARDG